MSNDSDSSIRRENLFSHIGDDFNKCQCDGCCNSHCGSNNQSFQINLKSQIEFLDNQFDALKSLVDSSKNELLCDPNNNLISNEEDVVKNPLLLKQVVNENVINRQRLADLETFHLRMREEIDLQKSELNEKNEEISKLKEELSLVRVERNENIFQVQSMLKDYDLYSKNVTSFNPPSSRLSLSIGGVNIPGKHKINSESISSVNTVSTTISNQNLQFEFDKMQKEKTNLENQLVMYKLKYAEQSSKLIELEDEKEIYKKKFESFNEKNKMKDEIIKSLIAERDSLKYSKDKINAGKSKVNLTNHTIMNYSPEKSTIRTRNLGNELYTPDSGYHTERMPSSYLHTEGGSTHSANSTSGSRTPNGIVKILKNIFTSEKK